MTDPSGETAPGDPLGLRRRVLVVAEIGNNHEGDPDVAEEMIRAAAEAGADGVKLQAIVPDRLVSPLEERRIAQLERFRLSRSDFERLSGVAADAGVLFLATPFDEESARFLEPIVPAYKIASGDNDFFPLLEIVAETGKPVLVSTGMADRDSVRRAASVVRGIWAREGIEPGLVLLHCVSSYPTEPEQANLAAVRSLRSMADFVGYSDHTLGTDAAVLAVAAGARLVEKHFTLDRDYSDFRDHRLSSDPAEMAELVRRIREAEAMLGDGELHMRSTEEATARAARRSIVARRDLQEGHELRRDDLDWLRPGDGISPGGERRLLGRRLRRPIRRGERILEEDVG